MSQVVQVPGLGNVTFPDGMSPEEMHSAITQHLSQRQTVPNVQKLPTPGLLGQVGEAFKPVLEPAPQLQSWNPTTTIGGAGKALAEQVTVPNLGMLLGGGKIFGGLANIVKEGGEAANKARFAQAALTTPFVVSGAQGLTNSQLPNWKTLTPPQKGAAMVNDTINALTAALPILFSRSDIYKSGLKPNDPAFVNSAGAQKWHEANDSSSRSPANNIEQPVPPKPATTAVPLNPGGAEATLSPELQAKSKVNSLNMAAQMQAELEAQKLPAQPAKVGETSPIGLAPDKIQSLIEQARKNLLAFQEQKALQKAGGSAATTSVRPSGSMSALFNRLGMKPETVDAQGKSIRTGRGYQLPSNSLKDLSNDELNFYYNKFRNHLQAVFRQHQNGPQQGVQVAPNVTTREANIVGNEIQNRFKAEEARRNALVNKAGFGQKIKLGAQNETGRQETTVQGQEQKVEKGQIQTASQGEVSPRVGGVQGATSGGVESADRGKIKRDATHDLLLDVYGLYNNLPEQGIIKKQVDLHIRIAKAFMDKQDWNRAANELMQAGNKAAPLVKNSKMVVQFNKSLDKSLSVFKSPVEKVDKTRKKEAGFVIAPEEMWKSLFSGNKGTKIPTEQMFNRLKNVLGEKSGTFEALKAMGLQGFLSGGKNVQEVQDWANKNAPKVEVRKFSNTATADQKLQGQLQHVLETKGLWGPLGAKFKDNNPAQADIDLVRRWQEVSERISQDTSGPSWQSIAPKSEQDMSGYVEIAVVKPLAKKGDAAYDKAERDMTYDHNNPPGQQFPSSHSFPPNTLGFVRGYMEGDTFHVIEVQSDWAQQRREYEQSVKETGKRGYGIDPTQADPLLPHYERLALKAAIDHARSEGATKIAISDAETAMMTEGHDREPNAGQGGGSREYIPQYEGMILHYDRTLPKIAEELTGSKGEKVSFGEHRMAEERAEGHAQRADLGRLRKDLIFKNPDGTPKTDVSAMVFDISGTKKPLPKEFSLYGKSGSLFPERAKLPEGQKPRTLKEIKESQGSSIVTDVLNKLDSRTATGKDITRAVMGSAFVKKHQGYDFPNMEAASPKVANAAAEFGNASVTGRMEADSAIADLTKDLPKDVAFWNKVGAVFYEDMRKAAGNPGKSVFSFENSPIKNEKDYTEALKNPQVKQAIERWKEVVQKPATEMHTQLGGSLLDVGEETGAFANLKALREEEGDEYLGTTPGQGPLAALKGKTSFGQQRKYTGKDYVWDARELGYRMLTKNYAKVQKDNFYKMLESEGQGKLVEKPSDAPEGMKVLGNPVRLRTIVTKDAEGNTISTPQNQWLAINPKLAPETKQLLQVNTSFGKALRENTPILSTVNQALLRVQVGLGIDLGFHTANDFAATLQAFKYNVPRAVVASTKAAIDYVRKDPEVQKQLLDMAHSGVSFRGQNVAGWGSKALRFVDTTTRLVLDREYQRQVEKGSLVDSPAERRRFVNARAGQYNKRFMTYLQQSAQESALGAFNVAGRNFNRLSVRALMASPGAKAPTGSQAVLNRLSVATGLALFALVTPSLYNEAKWGEAQPKGTRVGELAYSKNPDGAYNTVDLFKLALIGRGGRATGLAPIIKEQVMPRLQGEQTPPWSKTLEHSGTSIAATAMQPFWGPPLSVASALATGKTVPGIGFNVKTPGETGPPYFRAALSAVNPLAGPVAAAPNISSFGAKTALGGIEKRLGSVVGMKQTPGSFQQVSTWANYYKQRNNIRTNEGDYSPSEYGALKDALLSGDVDQAKQAYQQVVHEKSQRGDMSDEEARSHAEKDMQKYFAHLQNYNFINKEDEQKFMASLTPKQREVYATAQQQLKDMADLFFDQIQPKTGGRPTGIRPPSLRSIRHF